VLNISKHAWACIRVILAKFPMSCKSPAYFVIEIRLHNVVMTVSSTLLLQQVVDNDIHHDSM